VNRTAVLAAVAALGLTTAACGASTAPTVAPASTSPVLSSQPPATSSASVSASSTVAASASPSGSGGGAGAASGSAAGPAGALGPGCADYARRVPSGPGSFDGKAPLGAAAAGSPLLSDLTAAVSGRLNPDVDLVGTLDSGQYTVFAPVDSAFADLPAGTRAKLKTDAGLLTKILTYHVVEGRITPDRIAGQRTTVEGSTVLVSGTPGDLNVNGAQVICGGLRTANATVYLVDSVLMPQS
jgi:uncharacterized surface protein with fasciclin (FAS1) repeats